MKKIIFFLLLIVSLKISAQESHPVSSYYPYDICNPPCWLGIIPELSTSLDVDSALAQYEDLISPETVNKSPNKLPNGKLAINQETGEMQSGVYFFDILTPPSDILSGIASRIELRHGKVDLMVILASEEYEIDIKDVLEKLGMPDQIHMYYSSSRVAFFFIYLDHHIRANFYQSAKNCRLTKLGEIFSLTSTLYYSKYSAYSLTQTPDYPEILQPALIRFGLEKERNVPLDVWQSWLSGKVNETCFVAWQKLKPPIINQFISVQVSSIIGAISP